MGSFGSLLFRLALALWVGGMAVFTLLVTPSLFRRYGRDQAGKIVEGLIGGYFRFNLGVSAAAFVILLLWWGALSGFSAWFSLLLALAAVALNVYVNFKLYPEMQALKTEVDTFESEDLSPPRDRFRELHKLSMRANAALLGVGVLLLLFEPCLRACGPCR